MQIMFFADVNESAAVGWYAALYKSTPSESDSIVVACNIFSGQRVTMEVIFAEVVIAKSEQSMMISMHVCSVKLSCTYPQPLGEQLFNST